MRKILIAVFLCGLLALGVKLAFIFFPWLGAYKAGVPADVAKEMFAQWDSMRTDPRNIPQGKTAAELSPAEMFRAALEIKGDHPEIVPYLINEGIFPYCPSYLRSSLEQCAGGTDAKPETARALVEVGCDPTALLGNKYHRQFAVSAGILDENGKPLIHGEPSPELAAYWESSRQSARAWGLANPEDALLSRWFYSAANPDDVRAVIGKKSLDREYYEEEQDSVAVFHGGFLGEFFPYSRTVTRRRKVMPLSEAAMVTPYPEVLTLLAEAGARVREGNSAVVRRALTNPNPEVLKTALALKPDLPDALRGYMWVGDALPVHISMLVEAGFDFNKDTQEPLMAHALRYENLPVARALFQAGAALNRTDEDGWSALGEAIMYRYYSFAIELMEAGADSGQANRWGKTMKQLALECKPRSPDQQKDYVRLLQLLN